MFKSCVHDLIRVRNRIFNLHIDFSTRMDNPKEIGISPEGVIRFYELTKKMEHEERYDIFNTWNIKRTVESATITESNTIDEDEIELSDIENEKIGSHIGQFEERSEENINC
mmetsp:Transcript_38399/g.37919  ORF Transcript_38399/g.37919 Transcript_38399/m.37919 type:complete len:112 (+) Transcript_38399:507-842(+)